MPFLTEVQRRSVLDAVLRRVDKKFFGEYPDTATLRERHADSIVKSGGHEEFERQITHLLRDLGASHTGFFHERTPRAAGRIAIAATFTQADTPDGRRWIFQDVHPGGAAAVAGIRPGDTLLTVGEKDLAPPEATAFALGGAYPITVRRPGGETARATLMVPGSSERRRPIVVPDQVVTVSRLDEGVGLIRVSMFPGVLGMDVARSLSTAVDTLRCSRLIIDLRGNTGGGIGCLRLMSFLCPDRRGVGYTVDRGRARRGYDKHHLPVFDRIPASKLAVVPLMLRFALRGHSVAVYTERLGSQEHHGRVALLLNEHSASAAEMVAAFASEYRLATLVGTKTAGRLVATRAFKVGFGYRVALPVAAYYTWHDTNLEGHGVAPDVHEPLSPQALWDGHDNQLTRAKAVLNAVDGQ